MVLLKTQKAKVGIILDEGVIPEYIQSFIYSAEKSDVYEIDCLVLQSEGPLKRKSFLKKVFFQWRIFGSKRFVEKISFQFISNIEAVCSSRLIKPKKRFHAFDCYANELLCLDVTPIVSKSGWIYRYKNEDIQKILDRSLDVLIRGGSGILRGDILTAAKFGIISFHHGDNTWNRGGPPGFWEVYHKKKTTGFVLQILNEKLDGGEVIFKGNLVTKPLYIMNRTALYAKSSVFLHQIIEKFLRQRGAFVAHSKSPYSHKIHTIPSFVEQILYAANSLSYFFSRTYKKLTKKSSQWSVAYQYCNNWRETILHKSRVIENPSGHFYADPFLFSCKDKHYCFVEDFEYSKGKGKISVLELSPEGERYVGVCIEEHFHLSYPFIFEDNGDIFICPESHENNDIRLYKCVEFPLRWELVKVLMKNVDAADTSLFKKEGTWWLLTNICSAGIGDHNSELHIFSSKDLYTDVWIPHEGNPVIFDPRKARNGGLILERDGIYRVFQKQGWDLYGESCGVAKVKNISNIEYIEEDQFSLEPKFAKDVRGIHSYSYCDGVVAFDFFKS
jgi:hypothetical protein